MTTRARTLAALALTWTAALGPPSPAAGADDEDLAAKVRAFHAEQIREYDEAIVELRELIDEKARTLAGMEEQLREARQELDALEAFRDREPVDPAVAPAVASPPPAALGCPWHELPPASPTASAPRVIPGPLPGVVPASAVVATDGEWQGVVLLSATADGRLAILHESGDGSGAVQAGALQADRVELRVASPDDARILARSLRADGNPVVTWPDLRIAPEKPTQPDRLGAMERSIERLADAVDRLDRRDPTADAPPVAVEPPAEIPPAPSIPD